MNGAAPRVAFFTDSFHEVNGVALTSRQLEAFAGRRHAPFFSVHTGPETRIWDMGSVTRCELALGSLTFRLEADLRFDVGFLRHQRKIAKALDRFQPEVIHITGPSHIGLLGAGFAHSRNIPLVASWHTNIHEYGGRRLERMLGFLPQATSHRAGQWAERGSLAITMQFYRRARVTLAPNPELIRMLEQGTGKPCFLMRRGVDTEFYRPERRNRRDDAIVIGYVGRTSTEKNVRFLGEIENALQAAGLFNYRIFVAGHGSDLEWLRANLKQAEVPGVVKGEALAAAYANFDLFVFPSETDTYGNVVQEAMASGVPCVVTTGGGPQYIIESGVTGYAAQLGQPFIDAVLRLAQDHSLRRQMGLNAREAALKASWDRIFEDVYRAYGVALERPVSMEEQPAA